MAVQTGALLSRRFSGQFFAIRDNVSENDTAWAQSGVEIICTRSVRENQIFGSAEALKKNFGGVVGRDLDSAGHRGLIKMSAIPIT